MKEAYDGYPYAPKDIYNMDEAGFTLSSSRKTRRVAPTTAPIKSQASLADNIHVTVVASISISDSPVPPFLIYPGANLLEEWLEPRDKEPPLMATVSDSGYINGYLMKRWLTECFDPHTRERARGARRLLFLDGHETHVQVSFLEACWSRNIVCVVLPAHLSGIFQPLDVDFFNTLKLRYHQQLDDYQLGSSAPRVSKAYFYRWFQRAWKETATSRQIRSAWARSGLYPLDQGMMRARPITPPPAAARFHPETPQTSVGIRDIVSKVRRGEVDPVAALLKTVKALELSQAEVVLLKADLARRVAAEELDRSARGSKKRTRFPQGELFNQEYQDSHAAELAERREAEKQSREKKKGRARAKKQVGGPDLVETSVAGPSTGT